MARVAAELLHPATLQEQDTGVEPHAGMLVCSEGCPACSCWPGTSRPCSCAATDASLQSVPCQPASTGATTCFQQSAVHMTPACCQQSCKASLPCSRAYMHSCRTAHAQAHTKSFRRCLQPRQWLVHGSSFRHGTADVVCIKQASMAKMKSFRPICCRWAGQARLELCSARGTGSA